MNSSSRPWATAGLVALALATATSGSARAQCPTEPSLFNYNGAGTTVCPCFAPGEHAGVVLQAPASHYPIEILRLRFGWGSQFGGSPNSLEQALHIFPGGLPNPGAAQFSLPGPVLVDGFINEFNIEFTPGNKIINSGPFSISLEFANNNAGNPFAPSVIHDGNGCQGGKNTVFSGGWNDACVLGVSGDWVMEVLYRRVNCAPPPPPLTGPQAKEIQTLGKGTWPSTVSARNGAGHNLLGFMPRTPAVPGGEWVADIDLVSPGATASLLAIGVNGATSRTFDGRVQGELLVLPPFLHVDRASGRHVIPIPDDVGLVGMTFNMQGASVANGVVHLQNAVDVTVGTP